MAFALCQENFSDEDFARVANIRGMPRGRAEIQGRYDIRLSFDVRDLDQEYVLKKAEMSLKYLRPLDRRGVLPWERFLQQIVASVDPNWAEMVQPAEVADQRVVQEETDAYVRALSAVEPQMPEMIDNPELRLQTLQQLHMPRLQNPQAFAPISPAVQAILENREKYLMQQATQAQNAEIGRVGAAPVDLANVEAGAEVGR